MNENNTVNDDYYNDSYNESNNNDNYSEDNNNDNKGFWWKILLGILIVLVLILLLLKFCTGSKKTVEKTNDQKYAELKEKICGAAEKYTTSNPIALDTSKVGAVAYIEFQKLVDSELIEKNIENPYYNGTNSQEQYYSLKKAVQLTVSNDLKITCDIVDGAKDVNAPVIKLNGKRDVKLPVGTPYEDPRATAIDDYDGDITDKIIIEGEADYTEPGTYTIKYSVTDSSNNISSVERTVTYVPTSELPEGTVIDNTTPLITLIGDNPLCMIKGTEYKEPGVTATDNIDGDISLKVYNTTVVNGDTIGTFRVTYVVKDSSGNETIAYRAVKVAKECPVIETPTTAVIKR